MPSVLSFRHPVTPLLAVTYRLFLIIHFIQKRKCHFNNFNYLSNNLTLFILNCWDSAPILLLIFGASCELLQMPWVKSTCEKIEQTYVGKLHLSGCLVVGRHFQGSRLCSLMRHSLSEALCMWDSVFKKKWDCAVEQTFSLLLFFLRNISIIFPEFLYSITWTCA